MLHSSNLMAQAHPKIWRGQLSRHETRATKFLKGELKRRGTTYAQLPEKLAEIGIKE